MNQLIRIRPTADRRVEFARWAVAQRPKVDTVSIHEFAVPARLFAGMPESILIGSTVDGHRYVSPEEDAANGTPAPAGTPEPVTEPVPAGPDASSLALVGEPGPETVIPCPELPQPHQLGTETTPVGAPDGDRENSEEGPPYECGVCPREFTTFRGRGAHRRQVHPEA